LLTKARSSKKCRPTDVEDLGATHEGTADPEPIPDLRRDRRLVQLFGFQSPSPVELGRRPRRTELAALFWCLLMRGQDYTHSEPSLAARKPCLLEIRACAPRIKGTTPAPGRPAADAHAERELAKQAEASYRRTVADWQAVSVAPNDIPCLYCEGVG
jgi:hypothetical protein